MNVPSEMSISDDKKFQKALRADQQIKASVQAA
jgi:hypothetical protein